MLSQFEHDQIHCLFHTNAHAKKEQNTIDKKLKIFKRSSKIISHFRVWAPSKLNEVLRAKILKKEETNINIDLYSRCNVAKLKKKHAD